MSARSSLLITVAALSLAACDAASSPDEQAVDAATSAQTETALLTPSGDPVPLTLAQGQPMDDLQAAAGVVRLDPIPGESAKLFGTAGGDPAMNGLYTYIAFYPSPAEGWQVYRIGDLLDYTVLSHANGRVDLDIQESVMDEATSEIGSRHRKIIVRWTQGADDAAPTAVTVTPAE